MSFLLVVCSAFLLFQFALCERTENWDTCRCSWHDWTPWSSCTATCAGGIQRRSRKVSFYSPCQNFTDCATPGSGWDYKSCAQICFNGQFKQYSTYSGYCECLKGWKGSCCNQVVNCGTPSSISHGVYVGDVFTYNNRVTYKCDENYNMTDPSAAIRMCTEYGYWSGVLPRCSYATSCQSNPCLNGAVCTNLLGDYTCTCTKGWTGTNCHVDIQPPVVTGCPDNRYIYTNNMTSNQLWTEPTFIDPHGKNVVVSKNYLKSFFEFPWGEFTVQYSAVKPTNGMKEECTFNISVKPMPCAELAVPKNGYVVCNGWKTEYARVCKLMCLVGFTYPPGYKADDWYTCGASGNWLPSTLLTTCVSDDISFASGSSQEAAGGNISDCSKHNSKSVVGQFYIYSLKKSQFNKLCEDNSNDCSFSNVLFKCDNF